MGRKSLFVHLKLLISRDRAAHLGRVIFGFFDFSSFKGFPVETVEDTHLTNISVLARPRDL